MAPEEDDNRPRRGAEPHYHRSGPYLGLSLVGAASKSSAVFLEDLGGGLGVDAVLGLRMSRYVAFELDLGLTFLDLGEQDSVTLGSLSGNAKAFILPSLTRLEPYVLIGVGAYGLALDEEDPPTIPMIASWGMRSWRIRVNAKMAAPATAKDSENT